MQEENKNTSAISSLIPILILGIITIILFQYFDLFKPPSRPLEQNKTEEFSKPIENTPIERNDFYFVNKNKEEKTYIVDNQRNLFVLNSKGGRIQKIYLKSTENFTIPERVIEQSTDEWEKKYNALEITRNKGMDFQFHLYKSQIVNPIIHNANFDLLLQKEEGPIITIGFVTNVQFNNHPFTIYKIYRFLKKENFFHQITILQNNSENDFYLNGDLFFKPFSALGPEPEDKENSRILYTYGRFYNYNDSLKVLHGFTTNGSFFSCNRKPVGRFSVYTDRQDSLKYLGVNSRYFISYSQFLDSENPLHKPDGIILENEPPIDGSSTFSAIFLDFKLTKKENEELKILDYLNGKNTESALDFFGYLNQDKKRNDVLILDQIVYTGLRSDEEHNFYSKELFKSEFGLEKPESSVREVIYSSGFLALFSKLRDGIVFLMKFINKFINNYGITIILIALFFKLITYPLNQVQAKTMKKIHALKPEIDRINERYQDPAERQRKIMDIYKKHKINPAMGCLPILIQIPIFIALYSAFSESIELWKSPFIWWIQDLSQPDTVYIIKNIFLLNNFHINILPLLMVGSQLLLQKLTTVSVDPQQKFLMYFMPIIMIFFFWGMPSGVTLYWTVQNIISVIWQITVERFSKEEK